MSNGRGVQTLSHPLGCASAEYLIVCVYNIHRNYHRITICDIFTDLTYQCCVHKSFDSRFYHYFL